MRMFLAVYLINITKLIYTLVMLKYTEPRQNLCKDGNED